MTDEAEELVVTRTGLRVDPMFSAPKMAWLLRHAGPEVERSDIMLGTVDAWLVYRLTGGMRCVCEAGNASRTLLFDLERLGWCDRLLELFEIPGQVLPEVLPSQAEFGRTRGVPGLPDGIPIKAVLADSHAALLSQGGTGPGVTKATYGTGTSVMTPTQGFSGERSPVPTTLAWLLDEPRYAREGSILSSGSTLVWTARLLGLEVADVSCWLRPYPPPTPSPWCPRSPAWAHHPGTAGSVPVSRV